MAEAWTTGRAEIEAAFKNLEDAKERLRLAFGQDSYRFHFDISLHSHHYDNAKELIDEVRKDAWSALINRMELRKIMSIADQKKLDEQLEKGEGMPDITLPNLLAMLEGTIAKIPDYVNAAVQEVYDWLRPCTNHKLEYVTNQKSQWELKEKLILEWIVERVGDHWYLNHYREERIRALDNVFHALDGKGLPKGYYGPLIEAIKKLNWRNGESVGETEYFRFKCFKNGNLHLEFKRADLLAKFNTAAGGMRLKGEAQP